MNLFSNSFIILSYFIIDSLYLSFIDSDLLISFVDILIDLINTSRTFLNLLLSLANIIIKSLDKAVSHFKNSLVDIFLLFIYFASLTQVFFQLLYFCIIFLMSFLCELFYIFRSCLKISRECIDLTT